MEIKGLPELKYVSSALISITSKVIVKSGYPQKSKGRKSHLKTPHQHTDALIIKQMLCTDYVCI